MRGDTRLALRLLRGSGRRDVLRLGAMLLGVAAAVLGLLLGLAIPRVTAAAHDVQVARAPVLSDPPVKSSHPFQVQVSSQTASSPSGGTRVWTRVAVTGATGSSPLPPGIEAWPAAGQSIVSPALGAAAVRDPAVAADLGPTEPSRIGEPGLTGPDEFLSYTVVAAGATAAVPADGASAEPSVIGFGSDQDAAPTGGSAGTVLLETLLMVVLPALVFLSICLRLSAASRGVRAFALSLVGMSPSRSAKLYGREMTVVAVAGTALAFAVYTVGEGPLGSSGVLGVFWFAQQARLGWLLPLVALLASTVIVSRLAQRAMRASAARTRSARTRVPSRQSRLIGTVVLAPAAVVLIVIDGYGLIAPTTEWASTGFAAFVAAAVALGLLGVILAAPAAVSTLARLAVKRAKRGVRLGLRVVADDQAASKRLVALVAAVVIAASLGSAFIIGLQRTSLGDPTAAQISFDLSDISPADRAGLDRLPNAPHVLDIPVSAQGRELAVEIADCAGANAAAAATFPDPGRCDAGVQRGDGGVGTTGLSRITVAGHSVRLPAGPVSSNVIWDVKIPTDRAPWLDRLTDGQGTYFVSRSDGSYQATLAELHRLFPALPVQAGAQDDLRYALYQQQRGVVRTGLLLGLLLTLGAFVVSALENRWSRERSVVALAAIGASGRVLRLANATRFAFPVLVGASLAGALGVLGGWAYLSFYGSKGMFGAAVWESALAAVVLGTAVSAVVGWLSGGGRFRREAVADS